LQQNIQNYQKFIDSDHTFASSGNISQRFATNPSDKLASRSRGSRPLENIQRFGFHTPGTTRGVIGFHLIIFFPLCLNRHNHLLLFPISSRPDVAWRKAIALKSRSDCTTYQKAGYQVFFVFHTRVYSK